MMYIIMGATGHVGSTVATTLLEKGETVTIITRQADKAKEWEQKGATAAVVDILDVEAFRKVVQTGKRVFVLNPPALPHTDTVEEEKKSVAAILLALKNTDVEKIVVASTYGAQPGEGLGDLGVLYELEQGLSRLSIPLTIIRSAYYLSNWDFALESVQQEGKLYTFFPIDLKLPMIAPADIGKLAAQFLMESSNNTGLHYLEGPESYTPTDVAHAFSKALNKPVEPVSIPQEEWAPMMQSIGYSEKAAQSMAKMTDLTIHQPDVPAHPIKGTTTLQAYVNDLVKHQIY